MIVSKRRVSKTIGGTFYLARHKRQAQPGGPRNFPRHFFDLGLFRSGGVSGGCLIVWPPGLCLYLRGFRPAAQLVEFKFDAETFAFADGAGSARISTRTSMRLSARRRAMRGNRCLKDVREILAGLRLGEGDDDNDEKHHGPERPETGTPTI
jgi:hypothetical protein